jgi:hypothetical protein
MIKFARDGESGNDTTAGPCLALLDDVRGAEVWQLNLNDVIALLLRGGARRARQRRQGDAEEEHVRQCSASHHDGRRWNGG